MKYPSNVSSNIVKYSFLERGSDERQYCAPGVDLPVCGFCRTKYGEYSEYHTDADNFDVVTEDGLNGALNVMKSIVDAFEVALFPKINVKCEPQLSKYGLRPDISQKTNIDDIRTRSDFIAYADGENSVFDISNKIKKNLKLVVAEAKELEEHGLLDNINVVL